MSDAVLLTGEAHLRMLAIDDGGLVTRWQSGIRPNHRSPIDGEGFLGELRFADRDSVGAGEACVAAFRLLVRPEHVSAFVPGFVWELHSRGRAVGHATVLHVASASG